VGAYAAVSQIGCETTNCPMLDGIRVEHVGSDLLAKQQSHLRRNPNYLTALMSCHGKRSQDKTLHGHGHLN